MRNLKKALALVLALMMTVSLMATVSAADYADKADIEQAEAVDVMSALGVIQGMGNGSFEPDGNLTRAQAAKIITYMLISPEVASSLDNKGSEFTDCPDGQWYVGCVNYLTDAGIIDGMGDGTFHPQDKVNGYQFAKMLLCALGYDSTNEKWINNNSWTVDVATKARSTGMVEGMAVSCVTSEDLTREQACHLAFNTLTCRMVAYTGGVMNAEGKVVGATRGYVEHSATSGYLKADNDDYMQFCEQYFDTLKLDKNATGSDDFGRKLGAQWTVGTAVAYTSAAEASVVLDNAISKADLEKQLPKGVTFSEDVDVADTAALAALAKPGKVVEIYLEGKEVTDIITITYAVDTVKKITVEDDVTSYVFASAPSTTLKNTEETTAVVLNGEVAEGDTVTTVTANSKLYVYPTTSFTGSQTAKKGNVVTIGGAQYTVGTGVTGVKLEDFANSADELTYWADMNGYLVKVAGAEEEEEAPEYALIVASIFGSSAASLDNPTGYTVNVRAILADGTVEDRTLATSVNPDTAPTGGYKAGNKGDLVCGDVVVCASVASAGSSETVNTNLVGTNGKVFGYNLDENGKMELKSVANASNKMVKDTAYNYTLKNSKAADSDDAPYSIGTSNEDGGATALFTKDTVFVIFSLANGKYTATTLTGVSGQLPAVSEATVVKNAIITAGNETTGTASVVFLYGSIVTEVADSAYINVNDSEEVLNDAGKSVYKYTGVKPDGEKIDLYTATETELTASGVYEYDTNNVIGAACVTANAAATSATYTKISGAQVNNNLLKVGSAWVNMTDDTKVVYVDGLTSIAGNCCFVIMKSADEVATIYVYTCDHSAERTEQAAGVTTSLDCDKVTNGVYYTCDNCGAKFLSATATEVATDAQINTVPGAKHTATDPAQYVQRTLDGVNQHAVKCANSGEAHAAGEWENCSTEAGTCACGRVITPAQGGDQGTN